MSAMCPVRRSWDAISLILVISLLGTAVSVHSAVIPRVTLTVPDTTVASDALSGSLRIKMSNFVDTIAGFQFVLVSEDPSIVRFDFSGDGLDTAGTLVAGFEYAQAIDRAGDQSEYWFRCIANLPFDSVNTQGILPQQGGLAVRVPFEAAAAGSTQTIDLTLAAPTDFSDPWGNSIGVITDTVVDTSYWNCLGWVGDSCLEWMETNDSVNYDSMAIDSSLFGYLDSSQVVLNSGSLTIEGRLTCDLDGDGQVTVADLSILVQCLFGIPPIPSNCDSGCDANGDGSWNVADLSYLVDYLFFSGPPPVP